MPPPTDLDATAEEAAPAPLPMRVDTPSSGVIAAPPRFTAQAAVAAAGGLVAGAATVAMVRRRRARPVRGRTRGGRALGPVVASRSFIVDIHVLGRDS